MYADFAVGPFKGVTFHGEGPHRLAACTLIIGAPVGKNKIRMVDGKIENLWLINEETATRLDNICMMATLLGYLQTFCAGHEVPHLSCIQKSDHPAWLRDFFTVAGFNRCECLKPEMGGQRFRACLKLNSSGQAIEEGPVAATPSLKEQEEKATSRQLKTVPAAVVPAADPNPTVPASTEAPESVPNMKDANGTAKSSALTPVKKKPLTENQALEWLSQNQEILSPHNATKPKAMTAPNAGSSQTKPVVEASIAEKESTTSKASTAGAKRKREESITEPSHGEAHDRATRSRKDEQEEPGELRIKQGLTNVPQKSKPNPEPKPKDPILRYSSTIASQSAKPAKANEGQATNTTNMTDAILAQCSKPSSSKSPKQIKKEAPAASTRSAISQPPPDAPSRWGYNMPSQSLTCYYWQTQGFCKHRAEDCIYAHYDTGTMARPPGHHKKSTASSHYGAWSDVNGISVGGSHGNGSPSGGPKYDSWRP